MKLYYAKGACSLAPHIALRELGFEPELVKVDTKTKAMDGGGDFFQVNPKGYVPALMLDDGQMLTEASVVLQYLGDLKPAARLAAPAGSIERYRMMEWLNFVGTELHKSFTPLFTADTPEDYKPIARQKIARRQQFVDAHLQGKQYLLGDTFSVADIYLFVVTSWSRHVGVDLSAFNELRRFSEHVAQRPAVQAALKAEGLIK